MQEEEDVKWMPLIAFSVVVDDVSSPAPPFHNLLWDDGGDGGEFGGGIHIKDGTGMVCISSLRKYSQTTEDELDYQGMIK